MLFCFLLVAGRHFFVLLSASCEFTRENFGFPVQSGRSLLAFADLTFDVRKLSVHNVDSLLLVDQRLSQRCGVFLRPLPQQIFELSSKLACLLFEPVFNLLLALQFSR